MKKFNIIKKNTIVLTINLIIYFLLNNIYSQSFFEQISIKNNSTNYYPSLLGDNGWVLRAQDDIFQIGKFNVGGISDFIIQGSSGLGIITLNNNREFTTIEMASNGSKITASSGPEWTINHTNKVLGVGYFHPNYKHDILIQGTSGLDVISLDNTNNFVTTSIISNGSRFEGGWRYNNNDKILGIGDFNNDNKSDFIIKSSKHLGIISIDDNGRFTGITTGVNNSYLGDSFWRLKYTDEILGVGDFNGDNRSDFYY